ncbi:MAG: hypothetical protein K9I69_06165 [Ignavibacteriales bacterium]|nr:hypothetical protein [Ignavibacteriales bacterium]MCF8307225.1 hypothetical protein [Ignavibacteriales bacterium]MCF8316869.1 hypothetical protein [Ignavibacteriales bacterium]MCF8438430.1 hypothetical protein [Ignavibacteriales bacterium]
MAVKKILPFAGLLALTAALMIFFKNVSDSRGSFLDTGRNAILKFYTENLRPLFYKTEITDEDLFNFALYSNLPIDKENNKVLWLHSDQNGIQQYEIKPALINSKSNNYVEFVNRLNLDEGGKRQADSILRSYREDVYKSVLINDNNTYAVNPDLTLLHKALRSDLFNFALKRSGDIPPPPPPKPGEPGMVFSVSAGEKDIQEFRRSLDKMQESKDREYIFFTPDSIFKGICVINDKSLKKVKKDLSEIEKKIQYEYQVNSGNDLAIRVKVPNKVKPGSDSLMLIYTTNGVLERSAALRPEYFEKIRVKNLNQMTAGVDSAFREMIIPKTKKGSKSFAVTAEGYSFVFNGDDGDFSMNVIGLDSLINPESRIKYPAGVNISFSAIDSLISAVALSKSGTGKSSVSIEIKAELEKVQDQLRKETEKLKELQKLQESGKAGKK